MMSPKKPPKYNARKTTVDGITFDSAKEARRWHELLLLERAGAIESLERQVPLILCKGVKLPGEARARPPLRLIVDFKYYDRQAERWRFEDTKGLETQASRIKRHLALALHSIPVEAV
jgi:hypothetical protein